MPDDSPSTGICQTCGAGESFQIPVWEDPDDPSRGKEPDYVGCIECHTMQEHTGENN